MKVFSQFKLIKRSILSLTSGIKGEKVSTNLVEEKLSDYIETAHAMEENVHRMLGSMIQTTEDPTIRADLEHHREETERHRRLLRERLEAHGRTPSTRKELESVLGAMLKSLTGRIRGDKAGKNARDGYATEHMEIAAYELLERLALRAGDPATAEVARRNRADEEAMAKKIAKTWDKAVTLTLEEEQEGSRSQTVSTVSGGASSTTTGSSSSS